jgi:hypothetical protein
MSIDDGAVSGAAAASASAIASASAVATAGVFSPPAHADSAKASLSGKRMNIGKVSGLHISP